MSQSFNRIAGKGSIWQENQGETEEAALELAKSLSPAAPKTKLAFFSSGLGKINRGFEISTARFFRAVQENSYLDARLFAGGDFSGAQQIRTVGRDDWLRLFSKFMFFLKKEQLWKLAYVLEQSSFGMGLIAESLKSWQPDVVWTKEVPLAHILYEFRRISEKKYKIIFANGGGFSPRTYQQFDFIQHLNPEAYDEAIAFGLKPEKMTVLPNLVPSMRPSSTKESLRKEFGYEESDWIVITIAAWNRHHKRIDYLIEEFAGIADQRAKLLICGQREPDAEYLQELAKNKLGERARFITAEEGRIADLLALSDIFVLCSLYEGLGAVIIEAALSGLPVICHAHAGSRYILADDFWLRDLSAPGSLANALSNWLRQPPPASQTERLKASVECRFSEAIVREKFELMVRKLDKAAL